MRRRGKSRSPRADAGLRTGSRVDVEVERLPLMKGRGQPFDDFGEEKVAGGLDEVLRRFSRLNAGGSSAQSVRG